MVRDARPAAAAALLVLAFGVFQALAANIFPDLFIFRTAAQLALRGESPYHIAAIRAAVAGQYPDPDAGPDSFVNNCGFFMPPGAVVEFLPLALLPWPAAKIYWVTLNALAAFAVGRAIVLFRPAGQRPVTGVVGALLPFVLVLNFLTLGAVLVGQTSLIATGCVVAGLFAFDRGRTAAGAVLWVMPFAKPHVALVLLPLAWYLGGWRRAATVLVVVAALNVVGACLIGGSPLFLREYVDLVGAGHRTVAFNRAELAYEMTSWNRLLYVASGERVLVEQSAGTILVSYAVGFALAALRCATARARPSAAWALAMAAALSVVCPQVLAYELVGLTLAVPWVRDLFASGRRAWGLLAALLLAVQLIPFGTAERFGVTWHRPAAAVAFMAVVLIQFTAALQGAARGEGGGGTRDLAAAARRDGGKAQC